AQAGARVPGQPVDRGRQRPARRDHRPARVPGVTRRPGAEDLQGPDRIPRQETFMQSVITGKAYVLGDNVDTDQIIPAQYLTFNPSIPEEYKQFGKYALSSVPPSQAGLPKGHVPFHTDDEFVSPYKVVIAGKNFGCGSSREHAPIALDAAGIEAVVAE